MYIYKTEELFHSNETICITQITDRCCEPIHTHDFIEIVYILSGKMLHTIDGVQHEVKSGDILFMNYRCTHSFSTSTEYSYINLLFSPEHIGEDLLSSPNAFVLLSYTVFNDICKQTDSGKSSFQGTEKKEIEDILFAMLKEYREKKTMWKTMLGNHLNNLLIKILRKSELAMNEREASDMWQKLSEFIDSNLEENLTLTMLAKKCFYNPSYFSRLFREKFGMSMMEYITRKRLDRAVDLLSTTDLSVEKISEVAGFTDRNNMYRAFSRYLGSSPLKYRVKK